MYKRRPVNRIVSQELRAGNKLAVALSKTELKAKNTYYVWMKKSPRLKRWVKALEALCDTKRDTIVEDAFFLRLKNGTATGAEYFFYLCNRLPDRWQNNYRVEHAGRIEGVGTNVNVNIAPNKVMIFKDLKNDADAGAGSPHASEGAEGHRIEGSLQSP